MSTKIYLQKSTQKSTHLENAVHHIHSITDYSLNIATPYDDDYLK